MAKKDQKISLNLKISGRVQGVSYRAWTVSQANQLGLQGWVRNTADGGVEVYARGEKSILEELLKRCQQGPPAAEVIHIESQWQENGEEFLNFSIHF